MEVRSRSAQDRKLQTTRWGLWGQYDKIFNDKCSSIELKDRQKEVLKEGKGQSKVQQARLHPAIQKVESLEDMQIIGMKSAIHELQDLVTPTVQLAQQSQSQALRKHPNAESIIYESPQSKQIKGRLLANKNGPLHNQSVQYYKEQIQKLKSQLDKERSKSQEYLVMIKRLENSNSRLDRQISLLLLKWQKEHHASQRISTLQQDFKQQLIINLELEEVLLRQKEKIQKKHLDLSSEENYKAIVKQLKYQMNEQRKHAEKEVLSLKNIIEDKDNEISQLKQTVSKLKAVKQSEHVQIIEPSTKISCNFMERFSNFSKDMQAKLSQQIVSTNPSLQDTATIDLQVNRKKSESQYSKGNCPSLSIPLIDAKIIKKRAASKTDRT